MERFHEWLDRVLILAPLIILAAIAGAANHAYQVVVHKRPFSAVLFFIAMGLAGFLGLVLGVTPLPSWLEPYRESIACMLGFCTFPVMGLIEKEVPTALLRWMRRAFGVQSPGDPEN